MSVRASNQRNLLWLQSGGCGGCTLSLICAESPDFLTAFEAAGINVLWHPALSLETGREAVAIIDDILAGNTVLDILCLEGSVMMGPKGSGKFHMMAGKGKRGRGAAGKIPYLVYQKEVRRFTPRSSQTLQGTS